MSLLYVAFHGDRQTGVCEIAIYGQKAGYSAAKRWCVKPKCGQDEYRRQAPFSICIPAQILFSRGKEPSVVENEIDRFVTKFPQPRTEFCWAHADLEVMESSFPWLPWLFNDPTRVVSKHWVERVNTMQFKAGKQHDCGLHELEIRGNEARRQAGAVCALHQVHEMAMCQYLI